MEKDRERKLPTYIWNINFQQKHQSNSVKIIFSTNGPGTTILKKIILTPTLHGTKKTFEIDYKHKLQAETMKYRE